MATLPTPSPRLVRALVAALLLSSVGSLPLVSDEEGGSQVEALASNPPVDVEPDLPETTVPVDGLPTSVVPRLPRPRPPHVAVPPVTTPTLPPVTVPSLVDARARAACTAAVDGTAPLTSVLADTGAYVAAPDGTGVRRIARSDDSGTWSPDRRRLAYQVELPPAQQSALCVLDGTTPRLVGTLYPPGCCLAPGAYQVWGPGDRLVATDLSNHPAGTRVYDVGAGRVTHSFPWGAPHDLGPDGRTVAFLAHIEGTSPPAIELRLADVTTGAVRTGPRFDQEEYSPWMPRWLPGGSGLAYVTSGLRLLDLATGARRTLVEGAVGQYAFAPDGRIAYTTYLRGEDHGRVYVTKPDGSGAVEVADGPVRHLAWSPQGDRLLLASGHRNDAWLEVVGADGSNRRTVARAKARIGEHWLRFVVNTGWSPDSSRIEFGLVRDPVVDAIAGPTD